MYLLKRELSEWVREQAGQAERIDKLTGLQNHDSFKEYEKVLCEEETGSLGVMRVDIHDLKHINKCFGREEGDKLVRGVAAVLLNSFDRKQVYRMSGEEFLIICPNAENGWFMAEVRAIKEALEARHGAALSLGYTWTDIDIHVNELVSHAEERMRVSQESIFFGGKSAGPRHRMQLRDGLLEKIRQGTYKIYLQPKVDMLSGRITGAEALVRELQPGSGPIAPGKFIPVLERESLVRYIDLYIFEEVLKLLSGWQRAGRALLPISINYSRSTVMIPDIVQTMCAMQRDYGVGQEWVEVEITETLGDMEREVVAEIGRQLSGSGYRLALDDFGARYANFYILSCLKFDVLKMDKSIINGLTDNEMSRILVRGTLDICRAAGIQSVAEGVETQAQYEALKELGCDSVQGFYIGRPVPVETFEALYLRE